MPKLLLVDDSPTDRRIYRRFLEVDGLEIVEASTAREAVALAQSQEFDCILLDYRLPDGNGLDVLRELRGSTRAPVVFITGQAEQETLRQAYELGAVDFLSKDFTHSERLRSVVRDALGSARKMTRE